MARIRSVKPEFFRHEELQALGAIPMLFFEGLWIVSDKNGVFPWKPRHLKLDILPFMDYDPVEIIEKLEDAGLVQRFVVDSNEWGCIPSWKKHQKICSKESAGASRFPPSPIPEPTQNPPKPKSVRTRKTKEKEKEKEKEKDYLRVVSQSSTDLVPASPAKENLPEAMLPTFHAAKALFEESEKAKAIMYQDPGSAKREIKNLKLLVRRAHKLAPESPELFLAAVMKRYRELVNGKLHGKCAWTPSGLVTNWVWQLVLEGMQTEPTKEEQEVMDAVKGLFARKTS